MPTIARKVFYLSIVQTSKSALSNMNWLKILSCQVEHEKLLKFPVVELFSLTNRIPKLIYSLPSFWSHISWTAIGEGWNIGGMKERGCTAEMMEWQWKWIISKSDSSGLLIYSSLDASKLVYKVSKLSYLFCGKTLLLTGLSGQANCGCTVYVR